MTFDFEKLIS